jgi:uncharacterized protein YfbU (UPF0304 family)
MTPKSERFEMRLDQETIERLDDWRKEQGDMISRAEAARRLIEEGLEQYLKPRVLFSAGEKTLAMMLRDIYRHLKIKGDIDPEFLQSAITGGHTWGLKWQYPYIFNDRDDRSAAVTEVINILEMWAFISTGYKALSDSDKALVARDGGPFGSNPSFPGFDHNHEGEHSGISDFLLGELGLFPNFKEGWWGRNSHTQYLDRYQLMLTIFQPMRSGLIGKELSTLQIIDILKAMSPPKQSRVRFI